MPRTSLPESQIHPAVREKIASYRTDILKEVQAAVAANDIVVVGMRMNPFPKKARKALAAAGLAYQYLEYGSYLGEYRRRLVLKMWTGWPTFPMVFVKAVLVIRIGEPNPDLDELLEAEGAASAAFITAANPRGVATSAWKNEIANAALVETQTK